MAAFLDEEGLAEFWNQILAKLTKYVPEDNAVLKAQGTANANKPLVVGADGNVAPGNWISTAEFSLVDE